MEKKKRLLTDEQLIKKYENGEIDLGKAVGKMLKKKVPTLKTKPESSTKKP